MTPPDPLLAQLPAWAFAFAVVLARVGGAVMVLPGLGDGVAAEIAALAAPGQPRLKVFLSDPAYAPGTLGW